MARGVAEEAPGRESLPVTRQRPAEEERLREGSWKVPERLVEEERPAGEERLLRSGGGRRVRSRRRVGRGRCGRDGAEGGAGGVRAGVCGQECAEEEDAVSRATARLSDAAEASGEALLHSVHPSPPCGQALPLHATPRSASPPRGRSRRRTGSASPSSSSECSTRQEGEAAARAGSAECQERPRLAPSIGVLARSWAEGALRLPPASSGAASGCCGSLQNSTLWRLEPATARERATRPSDTGHAASVVTELGSSASGRATSTGQGAVASWLTEDAEATQSARLPEGRTRHGPASAAAESSHGWLRALLPTRTTAEGTCTASKQLRSALPPSAERGISGCEEARPTASAAAGQVAKEPARVERNLAIFTYYFEKIPAVAPLSSRSSVHAAAHGRPWQRTSTPCRSTKPTRWPRCSSALATAIHPRSRRKWRTSWASRACC